LAVRGASSRKQFTKLKTNKKLPRLAPFAGGGMKFATKVLPLINIKIEWW
jgi:hypothetical protein